MLNKAITDLTLRVGMWVPGGGGEGERRMGQTSVFYKKVKVSPGWSGNGVGPEDHLLQPHLSQHPLESWVGRGWMKMVHPELGCPLWGTTVPRGLPCVCAMHTWLSSFLFLLLICLLHV